MGCPKSPKWESEGETWSEDEGASSTAPREGNMCNDALHVIGLYGPGDKVSLSSWRIGSLRGWHSDVTLPWICCVRTCMRPGSWVDAARDASVSQQDKPFSHRGGAVTMKERVVVREEGRIG